MFNKFKIFIVLVFIFSDYNAQSIYDFGDGNGKDLNVLYRNDISAKLTLDSRGVGFSIRRGKHITAKSRYFYEGEIQSLRHPKQIYSIGQAQDRKRFIYGKLNSVYMFRGAFGYQNIIAGKGDNKAVEVRYLFTIGPSLAFAKPYYYQVYNPKRTEINQTEEVPFNSQNFSIDSIAGRGAFASGLEKTKIYPAITSKFNLSFEYANYTNLIRAIETGVTLDVFPKALPIMARNPSENFILTIHLGFVIGNKWF